MYFYKIGYHSYEDSGYIWLSHEQKFTEEEFENLVLDIAPEAIESHKAKEIAGLKEGLEVNEPSSAERTQKLIREIQEGQAKIGFDEVYEECAEFLCSKYGFKKTEIAVTYSIFGWADLYNNDAWKTDRDKKLMQLTKRLQEAKEK